MKKLFEISSEEKQRILEMHETATKKNYLSEQTAQPTQQTPVTNVSQGVTLNGQLYKLPIIKDQKSLDTFINWPNKELTRGDISRLGLLTSNAFDEKNIPGMKEFQILIKGFLIEMAKMYPSNQSICDSQYPSGNFSNAYKYFQYNAKMTLDELRKSTFAMGKLGSEQDILKYALAAAKQQINKFPNACSAKTNTKVGTAPKA